MTTKKISRLYYLFPIFGLIVCAIWGAMLFQGEARTATSASWPTTDGVVIKSEWLHHATDGCRFSLQFQYAYSTQGRKYTGNNYQYGGECNDDDVERIVSMYPVGAHVLVHYSPADPQQSVISPDTVSNNAKAAMAVSLILMALFGYLVFVIWRHRSLRNNRA